MYIYAIYPVTLLQYCISIITMLSMMACSSCNTPKYFHSCAMMLYTQYDYIRYSIHSYFILHSCPHFLYVVDVVPVVSSSLRPQPQSLLPSQGEWRHSILLRCSVVPHSLCLSVPNRLLCKSTRYERMDAANFVFNFSTLPTNKVIKFFFTDLFFYEGPTAVFKVRWRLDAYWIVEWDLLTHKPYLNFSFILNSSTEQPASPCPKIENFSLIMLYHGVIQSH